MPYCRKSPKFLKAAVIPDATATGSTKESASEDGNLREFRFVAGTRRAGAILVAVGVTMALAGMVAPLPASAVEPAQPVVTLLDGTNGCNGVRPTPGSENTKKRIDPDPDQPNDFNPGGLVSYIIDYPVDPTDVSGRSTFVITDCIFVDGHAVARYTVSFVPNTADFKLRFSVPVPADTPVGAQFCNYAKTAAAPSASQASNRKAGPACFTVGGALRIEKRSGSVTGDLLGGATFDVVCSPPPAVAGSTLPPTVVTGLSQASHANPDGTVSATGTAGSDGIAIIGPSGTPCTVTETAAPPGFQLDPEPRQLIIPVGTSQTVSVLVNHQLAGGLVVSKTTVGGTGRFTFHVSCGGVDLADLVIVDGGTAAVDDIPVGSECTVTEADDPLFVSVSSPADGRITVADGPNTVRFTNTRRTGDLIVRKTTTGGTGTFTFDVRCDGEAFHRELTITGSGSRTVTGIPTGTRCTVTEKNDDLFTSVSDPADGAVTIGAGPVTVAFTNTARTSAITLDKKVDGADHASEADALTVHRGDAVTYTVSVTNTGSIPVTVTAITDSLEPGIAGACPLGVGSTLAAGASFTCTYALTASGDATNVASVAVVDGLERRSTASDTTFVRVLNPAITLSKTADPKSVPGGGDVTFTYTVTNTGDTALTGVSVTDDVLGPIGVIGDLAAGASATLTRTQTVTTTSPTRNIGTVTGTDVLGRRVSASDAEDISIVLGVLLEMRELPRTGAGITLLARAGLGCVLLGLVLVAGVRRRRHA